VKAFGVKLRVKNIKITTYVLRGNMFVLRASLDIDDPDHPYNWIRDKIGVDPEDFGICRPSRFDEDAIYREWY
jgi:hypothetical protein